MTSCRCRACRRPPRVEGPTVCTVADCYRPVHCRGRCLRHYQQARYRGQLDTLPARQFTAFQRQCAEPGCPRWAHGRGLCGTHLKAVAGADGARREGRGR